MTALQVVLLPPFGAFLLVALGLVLARWKKRWGRGLALAGGLVLLASSVPMVGAGLLISHQSHPALPSEGDLPAADAIVVLGGDYMPDAPELGRPALGPLSMERVRYAADLARRTGLPVIPCGGKLLVQAPPLAAVMRTSLQRDFRVRVEWIEEESHDTRENALGAARVLAEHGAHRVLLVTHAWHMPRALAAFRSAGIEAIPAPTGFRLWPERRLRSFLPAASAFQESYWGLHEWLGRLWYRARWGMPAL